MFQISSFLPPDAPEVIEKLWDFARAAYLDNPMPTLFKERLFVFLSRFCPARYCLVRHCGFLVGYGNSSGDPDAGLQTIDQVIKLLTTPPPWHRPLDPIYESLKQSSSRLIGLHRTATPKTGCLQPLP